MLLLLSACGDRELVRDKKAVFDDLWESINRYCGVLEVRGVNPDSLQSLYRPQVQDNMSEDAFFALCAEMLLSIRDPHVLLSSPDSTMYSLLHLGYEKNIGLEVLKGNYLQETVRHGESVLSARLPENIGYIYVRDFAGETETMNRYFTEALKRLENTRGLILDMRENDGGSVYNAHSLLSKFADERQFWHSTQNRTAEGFDSPYEWYIEPDPSLNYDKPVAALFGRFTVSAGERFAIGARLLPRMILMGDTTSGTQGSVMGREMLNGWSYRLTFERVTSAEGKIYEGKGVPPDMFIEPSSLGSKDVILEEAMQVLR